MNTEELKTFIFLSKVKNFTLAAEQMYIAQSTVTNRISELEKELITTDRRELQELLKRNGKTG